MAKVVATHVNPVAETQTFTLFRDAGIVISATVFLAACAHVSFPLLFTPVPLRLQNFGVLLVALVLGPNRAVAALTLYLLQGAAGLPVFSPAGGPGGIAQLFGPTGGFLLAYPLVGYVAGSLFERMGRTIKAALVACLAAELLLFISGAAYLRVLTASTMQRTIEMAVLPFLPGEALKIAAAVGLAARWHRRERH
jgi:biotin transport system substrate-specific component